MRRLSFVLLALAATLLSGCAAIGDVFKAGEWVGVLGVVLLLVIVGVLFSMFRRK